MKPQAPDKKLYVAPKLEVYGDIREITQNLGITGMGDGGFLMLKTAL